jgi:hypothetical protein
MIAPDRLASWRRKATPELLAACDEIEELQAEVRRLKAFQENTNRYNQAEADRRDVWAKTFIGQLTEAEAARDLARDAAVALEQQLAEIKRLAYIGGQSDSIVRRCIIGVFEDDRRALEGGEAPC